MLSSSRPLPKGFSLVELSIVLVILGLLVGGILSGKSLIRSAMIRAQIVQIDQVVTAAQTFRDKYFSYPGDLPTMTSLPGGPSRQCWDGTGLGNGDGLITMSYNTVAGEASLFWVDLSVAGLLPGKYTYIFPSNNCTPGYNFALVTGTAVADYIPPAKLGENLSLYVWEGGVSPQIWTGRGNSGNYITISQPRLCGYNGCGELQSQPTIRVADAYAIDMKKDDGKPQTGSVLAAHFNGIGAWVGQTGAYGSNDKPNTNAAAASPTSCYDLSLIHI